MEYSSLLKVKRPVRQTFLPFALPHITQAEIDEVVDTLRSGWLTTGPRTKRFEREFAGRVGAPYAWQSTPLLRQCTSPLTRLVCSQAMR